MSDIKPMSAERLAELAGYDFAQSVEGAELLTELARLREIVGKLIALRDQYRKADSEQYAVWREAEHEERLQLNQRWHNDKLQFLGELLLIVPAAAEASLTSKGASNE